MSSYITQLEILRDFDRTRLAERVEIFCINKCIKNIQYYIKDSKMNEVAKHECYVYYTDPFPPNVTLDIVEIIDGKEFTVNIESDLFLAIEEIGIRYSKNIVPLETDLGIVFSNNVYGIQTMTFSTLELDSNVVYYFRPYVLTCIGTTWGTIKGSTILEYLLDTYSIPILDTDDAYIYAV